MSNRRVMVGITTYKDYKYLHNLLQSIRYYTYIEDGEFDLVVCDDGTEPVGEEDRIRRTCEYFGAHYVHHPRNLGIPAAWNTLSNFFSEGGNGDDIIVLLNNDMLMVPNWLRVAVHFLDTNKHNPIVGSCFWNPINRVSFETMCSVLNSLANTTYETRDQVTGKQPDFFGDGHYVVRQGAGQGLGRTMCPAGPGFAFRREVFDGIGPFPEDFVSFHEESVAADRYIVTRSSDGFIRVETAEDLFTRAAKTSITCTRDGKEYVFPEGIDTLSARLSRDRQDLINHQLGPLSKIAIECDEPLAASSPSARLRTIARRKLRSGIHVNIGLWDEIPYIVRHRNTRPLIKTENKYGLTVTTPDHSLIMRDGADLVGATPAEIEGKPLERVWEAPPVLALDSLDLLEVLPDDIGLEYDDEHLWYQSPRFKDRYRVTFRRHFRVRTAAMRAFCRLLGAYVSEGSISKTIKESGVEIYKSILVSQHDRGWCEECADDMAMLSNVNVSISQHGSSQYSADAHGNTVARILEALCGIGSLNKRVPFFVFSLPEEDQNEFLESIIRGDGNRTDPSVRDDLGSSLRYTTVSPGLAADMSLLFLLVGERAVCSTRPGCAEGRSPRYDVCTRPFGFQNRGRVGAVCTEFPIEDVVAREPEWVYDLGTAETGMFVDAHGMILVHNSDWGTRCAEAGRAAFGFAYPRPLHTHGYTFAVNPELRAGSRMKNSRRAYRKKWNVPENVPDDGYFKWVHERLMTKIPQTELTFLSPDYDAPPDIRSLPGGEKIPVPHMKEVTGEY